MLFDSNAECFQPTQHQETVHRSAHCSATVLNEIHPFRDLLVPRYQGTHHHIRVSAQILGHGMHHHVGTEIQWLLQSGCVECVIHHEHRPCFFGNSRHGFDVDHIHHRIGRSLHPNKFGVRIHLSFYCCQFSHRDEVKLDPESFKDLGEKSV